MKSSNPLIYLITEGAATLENFPEQKQKILKIIRKAVEHGVALVQIREKQLTAKLVFELAREAALITKKSETKLLVSDRADIALAANADGVHLTERSLSAETIRQVFPADFIIGISSHTIEKADLARRQKADFTVFGPVFKTPGKSQPQGLKTLHEVCEHVKPFPVLALGGIDETNYEKVMESGASGFAAIRFLNDEKNLKSLTK